MTYLISYDDGLAATSGSRGCEGLSRPEYFRTRIRSTKRARQLIEDGNYYGIAVHDASGSILAGIRLQLSCRLVGFAQRRRVSLTADPSEDLATLLTLHHHFGGDSGMR